MAARTRIHVDVTPTQAYEQRVGLFTALESAYPVQFRAGGNGNPAATVAFISEPPAEQTTDGPTLWVVDETRAAGDRRFGAIAFSDSGLVPRPFRGRTLTDSSTPGSPLPKVLADWGDVLATSSEGPVWSGREGLQFAAASWPSELASNELLRQQLSPGRFMGLLPLAHFLQQVSRRASWEQPQSKACFLFDDPNLHWWSYGFLDYRKLSTHAEAHDYHVTAATIPLDQWYIHRPTAEFLGQQSRISFVIHGNNHTRHELRRVNEPGRALTLAAQALRRAGAVERAGAQIAPVMVPPHGVTSVAMLEGCLLAGFDAMCADWPYWWLTEPNAVTPLAGWQPLDRLGGLPVIPRTHAVAGDPDDLVFRAFMGQPLVLYAHHTDLKAGLDVLTARAEDVRSLGVDSWQSLGSIAQDVVSTYRGGDSMTLALYSRRAVVEIKEGVSLATFVVPGADPFEPVLRLELHDAGGSREVHVGERVPVRAGAIVATVRAEAPTSHSRGSWSLRAVVRRLLTESRDRAVPLSRRVRTRARLQGGL